MAEWGITEGGGSQAETAAAAHRALADHAGEALAGASRAVDGGDGPGAGARCVSGRPGLGIGYGSLKDRLGADGGSGTAGAPAFVAVDGAALFAPAPASGRGEVELSDARGLKLVIRLAAGQAVEVATLVAAFRTAAR